MRAPLLGFLEGTGALPYIAHMKSHERRSAPRVPVSVRVQQHVAGRTHDCIASDLSLSGMYMERPLTVFARDRADVELEIPIPDGAEPLWATAEVVYDCVDATFHGTAVRFTKMSPRDRARLRAFLAPRAATSSSLQLA